MLNRPRLAATRDMSRGTCLFGLAVTLLLLGTACRGNNLASGLARPPEIDAQGQSRCGVMKSSERPLIIEWPSSDRGALEGLVKRREGLVAVRYAGCEMEVVRRCTVRGRYDYTAVEPKRDDQLFRSADDLYAKIPIGAAQLEAELARHQLRVAGELVLADAEHHQLRVARGQPLHLGQRPPARLAVLREELDDHHLAPQLLARELRPLDGPPAEARQRSAQRRTWGRGRQALRRAAGHRRGGQPRDQARGERERGTAGREASAGRHRASVAQAAARGGSAVARSAKVPRAGCHPALRACRRKFIAVARAGVQGGRDTVRACPPA